MNKSKNVVAVAAAQTYEMIIRYGIHAHPAVVPFPKPRDYLVPIKKGGQCENVYGVVKTIDILPEQIENVLENLDTEYAELLMGYYTDRIKSYGFSKSGVPYRFYIMRKIGNIQQPYFLKGIQNCVLLCLEDIPIVVTKD